MTTNKYYGILLISVVLLFTACKKEEEFKICVHSCPSGLPWTVESLDLGLPCFPSQDSCNRWAVAHGYSGKPCVTCN